MVASELLRGEAPFVADTSAWWRAATLPGELDALRILRNDRAVADAAMAALGELAEHGGVAVLHRDAHFEKLAEVLSFECVELPVG